MYRLVVASLTAAGLSVGLTAAASAADLGRPTPAPVYTKAAPAPGCTWCGFYLGVNAGAAWGDGGTRNVDFTSTGFDPGPSFSNSKVAKGIYGIHGGYNWQVTPNWVLGAEGDYDWTTLGRTNAGPLTFLGAPFGIANAQESDATHWIASARARVGYAWGQFMPYATGGAAWSKRDFSGFVQANGVGPNAIVSYSDSKTVTGWVAGVGLEYQPIPHVVLRAEYLHYGFSNGDTITGHPAGAPTFPIIATYNKAGVDVARAGVSYLFGGR